MRHRSRSRAPSGRRLCGVTGGGVFSPANLGATVSLWYSADVGSFSDAGGTTPNTDGTTVALLRDRSPNANHGTQATAGNRGTWLANVQNGLPGIQFAGASSQFLSFTTGLTLAQSTIVMVWMAVTPADGSLLLNGASATNLYDLKTAAGLGQFVMEKKAIGNCLVSSQLPLAAGAAHVLAVRYNGTTGTIRTDGVNDSGVTVTAQSITAATDRVGATTGTYTMCEVILCSGTILPDATMQQLEGYLKRKWGTP